MENLFNEFKRGKFLQFKSLLILWTNKYDLHLLLKKHKLLIILESL